MVPGWRLQTEQPKPRPLIKAWPFRSLTGGQAPPLIRGEIRRRVGAEAAHHQPLIAANGENIGLVTAFEHDAQTLARCRKPGRPTPRRRNARIQRRLHHGDADLRLGGERHAAANPGGFPAPGILDPILRQIRAGGRSGHVLSDPHSRERHQSGNSRSGPPCRCIDARHQPNGDPS